MKNTCPPAQAGMKDFITFEGCEGAGKSAQVRLLHEYMQKQGLDAVMTREPGGSATAEKIRGVILDKDNAVSAEAEVLLYLAARAQHLEDVIKPAFKKGKIVLCDRYTDSTVAYQGIARGLGAEKVRELNRLTVGDYMPALTVFLDVPPEVAFARKGGVDMSDRMEREGLVFHQKVYDGYKQIAGEEPGRFVCVDARGSKLETHEKIVALLQKRGIL